MARTYKWINEICICHHNAEWKIRSGNAENIHFFILLFSYSYCQFYFWQSHSHVLVFRRSGTPLLTLLTHWGRVTHICVSKTIIIGSDNGLSPGRRQAIIWTDAGILLNGPWGTNFSEISIKIYTFSRKCIWKCRLGNGGHVVSATMC